MNILTLILMAVALSVDGFVLGLSYGIKKVQVKTIHILLISASAAVVMIISILLGKGFGSVIPNQLDRLIGGIILVVIGLWQLVDGWKKKRLNKIGEENKVLLTINLKFFGIIFQVIKHPTDADIDQSGDINFKEALLLGIALNIDAFATGIGLGIAAYSLIIVPLVSLFIFMAIVLGLKCGINCSKNILKEHGYVFASAILIFLGIFNILK